MRLLRIFFAPLFFSLLFCLPAKAAEKLKFVLPLNSTAALDQALSDTVKEFNFKNSDYSIELIRRGGPFQTLRNIIAMHYAKSLPDFALVNEADLPTLINLKTLHPLPEKWLGSKQFHPYFLSKVRCSQNKICSIPFQRHVPVWFFNREALFRLNQATEHIPTTAQALFNFSLKLDKSKPPGRESDVWSLAIPGSGESALTRWSALGLSNFKDPLNATLSWLEMMHKSQANWLPARPSAEEATRQFLDQKAVILLGSLEQWNYLKTNAPFKIGSSLPQGELSWYGTDFVLFVDPASARGRKVLEFIDFVLQPSTWLALYKAAENLPISSKISQNPAVKAEISNWPILKMALGRKLKSLELDKISPHIREEWANQTWLSIDQRTAPIDLKATLQKLLSTQTR